MAAVTPDTPAAAGGRFAVTRVAESGTQEDNTPAKPLLQNLGFDDDPENDNSDEIYGAVDPNRPWLNQFVTSLTQGTNPANKNKLGVLFGVFLPCIQNIFGVLLFARLFWLVGTMGVWECFAAVSICICCTLLTSFSISALATNGTVSGGGAYFIISRMLGKEFGGAVGILFFIGNCLACAMYITGAIEMLLMFLVPSMAIEAFGSLADSSNLFNNSRIYGTVWLLLTLLVVCIGIKFVSVAGFLALVLVLLTIVACFTGFFTASAMQKEKYVCAVGDRILVRNPQLYGGDNDTLPCCNKESTCNGAPNLLYEEYCGKTNDSCEYFKENVRKMVAIPGLGPESPFGDNIDGSFYSKAGNVIPGKAGEEPKSKFEVTTSEATHFFLCLGIFFPSVTGILAGSNRSGDLANPGHSIPFGTIAAVLVTGVVYIAFVFLIGATYDGVVLRDKYGYSLSFGVGGTLLASESAWPHPMVVKIGAFASTSGAGLQALTSASRLLAAIASDELIPVLRVFSTLTKRGEPFYAQLFAFAICEVGVLIGNLDVITNVVTMFFLLTYFFVNGACFMSSVLKLPHWRPSFKFYHWSTSLAGSILCVTLMFVISWWQAVVAIVIAIVVYKYIEFKGAEKEWGDGLKGLQMSTARYALLMLPEEEMTSKSWRPQVLCFVSTLDNDKLDHSVRMVSFLKTLKYGTGITVLGEVVVGDLDDPEAIEKANTAKSMLQAIVKESNLKGFTDSIVASNVLEGVKGMVQMAGLGGMKPNSVLIGWPDDWRNDMHKGETKWRIFISLIRVIRSCSKALIVMKSVNMFPSVKEKRARVGNIDVWWIVHDGGLLVLLPYLLLKHRLWRRCHVRIFCVCRKTDKTNELRTSLANYLTALRIPASVEAVAMDEAEISAYVYEKTMRLEETRKLIESASSTGAAARRQSVLQTILDQHQQNVCKVAPDAVPEEGENGKASVDVSAGNNLANSREEDDLGALPNFSRNAAGNEFTFTAEAGAAFQKHMKKTKDSHVKKMHNAHRLNGEILGKSRDSELVILNLPAPPKKSSGDLNYMEYIEVLTENLPRALLVRGSGQEVVSINF